MTREEMAKLIETDLEVWADDSSEQPRVVRERISYRRDAALAKADAILNRYPVSAPVEGEVEELIRKLTIPGLPTYLSELMAQAASTLRAQAAECLQSMETIALERARAEAAEALVEEAREVVGPFARIPAHGTFGGPLVCIKATYEDGSEDRYRPDGSILGHEAYDRAASFLSKLESKEGGG